MSIKLAISLLALLGLTAEPALARMMTSSSFASRGVSVGPRTSVGTLKSFNASPGRGLTSGQTQSSSSQGTAFKRYKFENAWPSKGTASSGRAGGSGHSLLLPAVKSAGADTDAGLLLPAVQPAREPARAK